MHSVSIVCIVFANNVLVQIPNDVNVQKIKLQTETFVSRVNSVQIAILEPEAQCNIKTSLLNLLLPLKKPYKYHS